MSNGPVKLYSMVICPFAQRTRIQLTLKQVPFELHNLDICQPRPTWFLDLNPSGQVPVLINGDDVVSDSSIVGEYVEEAFSNPIPFGSTPAARAEIRAFINFVDRDFIPALYLLMCASTPEEREMRLNKALDTWRWVNRFLEKQNYSGGFISDQFGMAEVSIAPFMLRYEVVAYYQNWSLPDESDFDNVRAWRKEILASAIVQSTAESIPDLIKMYEDYTLGYFNGAVPPGRSKSSSDLSVPLASRPLPPKAASVGAIN